MSVPVGSHSTGSEAYLAGVSLVFGGLVPRDAVARRRLESAVGAEVRLHAAVVHHPVAEQEVLRHARVVAEPARNATP